MSAALSFSLSLVSALPLYRDSLPNGLVVLTYEDHRLPMIDIALVCRSGAAFDPPGLAGTASLTTYMLTRGTGDISGDSVSALVEYLGALFEGTADHDHCVVRLRMLAKDFDNLFGLFTASVLYASFSPKEFHLAQEQFLSSARRRYESPRWTVSAAFDRLLYNNHPYAWPAAGDTGTLPAITREDVAAFHRTHFVPNNCFIVVVGDIQRTRVLDMVMNGFREWKDQPVPRLEVPDLIWPERLRVKVITRPDMNQSYVEFGHPGISVQDTDLIAVRLMSYILGGSPLSSRIGLSVREEGGLAYDTRCWFDRRILTAGFHATVQTRDPRSAIERIFAEIRKMHEAGATAAELLKARNYFTGSFPLTYSSNQGKLNQVITQELCRFGDDWLRRFPDEVEATTLEKVNRAARQRLRPDQYYLVIMGPLTAEQLGFADADLIH